MVVRGFNLAWPPLAYSIRDDDEARRGLLGHRHLLRAVSRSPSCWHCRSRRAGWRALLAAPEFFGSFEAVPLVSTGVALYALYLVLVVSVGRTGRTEFNFPVTVAAAA